MRRNTSAREPEMDLPGPESREPALGAFLVGWALLFLRAARRRKWIAAAVFLLVFDAAVVYYRTRTPIYRAQAKILAQRQQALPSIVRSAMGDDFPARTAWDLVHRRENLIDLINAAGLLPKAGPEEPPGLRARLSRFLSGLAGTSAQPEDPLNALVTYLDTALEVTPGEGTITIAIEWPDAQQAYRLVDAAVQNFLEARHIQEISAIDEVISLLQGRLATLRDELDRATEKSQRDAGRGLEASPRAAPPRPPPEDLVRLRTMIEAKERAIADVEGFRLRRLADLQAQLDAQRAVYSDAHPSIITLQQDIAALSRESPQISALRDEEGKLRQEYAARNQNSRMQAGPAAPTRAARGGGGAAEEDERVRNARFQYQQMVERVNQAQLDLDSARAAFKFRYNLVWPPEMPKRPVSPSAKKVLGLAALAALFLAFLAAALPDLRSGRVVERWQVERSLDLPILGEVGRK